MARLRPLLRTAAALSLIVLTACATTPRAPAPETTLSTARPYGIPGVLRVWGDAIGEAERRFILDDQVRRIRTQHADALATGTPIQETALALSGGGADGAFGAGLLAGWTARGDRPKFDLVTGVSTGAIIGLLTFLGPDYDDRLRSFYTEFGTDDLLEPSPFAAVFGGDSISDTAGYNAIIDDFVDDALVAEIAHEARKGRTLIIGTTNIDAGRPVVWNVTAIAASGHPDAARLIRDLVRASSAIPALFPPVVIPVETEDGRVFDEVHVDGGATQQVMLFSPELPITTVDQMLGATIDRQIYIVINNSFEKPYDPVDLGILSIAGKAVSSLIGGSGAGDVYKIYAIAQRDGIDFNLLWIPPSFDAEASEPFDVVYMRALYELGFSYGLAGDNWSKVPPNFIASSP